MSCSCSAFKRDMLVFVFHLAVTICHDGTMRRNSFGGSKRFLSTWVWCDRRNVGSWLSHSTGKHGQVLLHIFPRGRSRQLFSLLLRKGQSVRMIQFRFETSSWTNFLIRPRVFQYRFNSNDSVANHTTSLFTALAWCSDDRIQPMHRLSLWIFQNTWSAQTLHAHIYRTNRFYF